MTALSAADNNQSMTSEKPSFVWVFQSPQVTEIYSHMTDEEREHVRWVNMRNAVVMGVSVGIASTISKQYFGLGGSLGRSALFSVLIAFGVALLLLPWLLRSAKASFTSTEYAKSHGIEAKNLRLYSFRRRDPQLH